MLTGILLALGAAHPSPTFAAEGKSMKNLFAQTETVCAGRLILVVPRGTHATLDGRYYGVRTGPSHEKTDFEHLGQELQKRADALKAEAMDASLRESYAAFKDLASTEIAPTRLVRLEKDPAGNSIFLAYHKSSSDAALTVEQHKLIQQQHYTFILEDGLGANDYAARKARLVEASQSFVPRAAGETPKPAGFCVDGGYYSGRGQPEAMERFTLTLKIPAAPDVSFTLDSSVLNKKADDPSLIERLAQRSGVAGQIPGFRVLRQGSASYGGFAGDEVLSRSDNDSLPGGTQQQFQWESAGSPGSVQKPTLEAEMTSGQAIDGQPHPSSFADAEAIEFWGKLLGSLQLRSAD
jgi:hypothetical protein